MQYVLLFLEGIITFISPCLLPMLPVYLIYFAGSGNADGRDTRIVKPLINAIGFVIGFTVVFVALGAFAGFLGRLLTDFGTEVNIITGLIVVLFGLNYIGILQINFYMSKIQKKPHIVGRMIKPLNFFSAFIFGIIFSIGWTPCVSAFLGAALLRASQQGYMIEGMFMLFIFSMGLGLPFIVCAVLINRLKYAFSFIKKHYRIINILSGGLLVVIGILMMTGVFGRFITLFAR
ncbi:MAG: cytochrome c biogenesis protein CcdA [Defluviitaleaceae bacterium]|nr:cytochrome c biogenesis protein CcdA [Defluviitaleaceae bacterium]